MCIAETGKLCLYSSRAISLYSLGAGKALSYGSPLVEFVKIRPDIKKMPLRREKAEPLALILTPTHELAIEVHETLLNLCYMDKTRCILVYGGPPSKCQVQKLSAGCDILIATPGRLLSFLKRSILTKGLFPPQPLLSLRNLQFMVFDEADKLLSQSSSDVSGEKTFEEEINKIEEYVSMSHKAVYHWFFSSQYTKEQAERAQQFMCHERGGFVTIDFDMPNEDESQRYTIVERNLSSEPKIPITEQKMRYLQEHHFASPRVGMVLILALPIKDADMVEYYLNQYIKKLTKKTHGGCRVCRVCRTKRAVYVRSIRLLSGWKRSLSPHPFQRCRSLRPNQQV